MRATVATSLSEGKRVRRVAGLLLVLALSGTVAGCAVSRETTGSISGGAAKPVEQLTSGELAGAAASLGRAYTKDTTNKDVALRYANVLQMRGQADQSLAVMRKLVIDHPNDRAVLAAYGKSLASAGQFEPALDAIRRAQTPEYPDWKLYSAEGAILDQIGDKAQARELYRKALDARPNEPSVLSNLGMSYVLDGDLKTAETYLRSAAEQPGADSRVRQNLALVVGLQGRFGEAERIAGEELSPEQDEANMAYLREMLAQQNAWSQIKAEDRKKATN
jgi:Flp pilus assembly protein TadD